VSTERAQSKVSQISSELVESSWSRAKCIAGRMFILASCGALRTINSCTIFDFSRACKRADERYKPSAVVTRTMLSACLLTNRRIRSICSRASCTESRCCDEQGTYADQNCNNRAERCELNRTYQFLFNPRKQVERSRFFLIFNAQRMYNTPIFYSNSYTASKRINAKLIII